MIDTKPLMIHKPEWRCHHTPTLLAETDSTMLVNFRFQDYVRYILLTLLGRGSGDRIRPD